MDSPHFNGSDDRDLSARVCDRCQERDAVKRFGADDVCAQCWHWLDNDEPAAPTFDDALAARYPKTAEQP